MLLSDTDEKPTGRDRTSLAFTLDRDEPGGLHRVLGELATRKLNLSRIESRPRQRSLGHYVFYIDVEGHRKDEPLAQAIQAARALTDRFWILGSYPRAT